MNDPVTVAEMKNTAYLVKSLREKGIGLSISGENLQISKQEGEIDDNTLTLVRENKNNILEYLRSFSTNQDYHRIPRAGKLDSYPLSDAQKRLWILHQLDKGSAAYNMPFQIELKGVQHVESLTRAISATIERHEILRTVFREDGSGEVRQFILPAEQLNFKMDYCDLSQDKDKDNAVKGYIIKDSYKPFNLAQGPLLRVYFFQLSSDHYIFYCNMHHIISDGWSMEVLSNDVLQYYEHFRNGKGLQLPELAIQYKDYAVWQLAQLGTGSFQKHSDYWKGILAPDIPVINLPTTKRRPLVKTDNGHALGIYFSAELSSKLKDFSLKHGGTLFMGLLASIKALLYRYTDQNDIVVGTPTAGRDHTDLEGQIGFYVNTLVLRSKVNGEGGFNELFSHVKHTILEAYTHQHYPFDRLVGELNIDRDTSRSVIFDVMVSLQNNERKCEDSEIVPGVINDCGVRPCKFDLTLFAEERGGCLFLEVEYNVDVYERATIEKFMRHYQRMLDGMLRHADKPLLSLDFLTEEEKKEIRSLGHDPVARHSNDEVVTDLFKRQVEDQPDHVAVVYEDTILTFKALDELTNQLARHLRSHYNIQPDNLVGIKVERSDWTVVAILGVLKSGGAYIPIDPDYPQERIDYIAQDSNFKLSIDDQFLKTFAETRAQYSRDDLLQSTAPNNLAYVIYTSGTSGMPKGVMVTQFNLVSFMTNLDTRLRLSECRKLGVTTNFTFDISILEIIGGLCTGKTVYVFSALDLMDPVRLMNRLHDVGIEGLQLTPSRLSLLYETRLPFPASLKVMLVGGEAMPQMLYERLQQEPFEAINVYGPTETTIWSTSLVLKESKALSIGRPLQHEQIYILNSGNLLQPEGLVGELCIGGEGVALGYLNKPELTDEKFIENPFKKGERLYKTGDLGRWLADGSIEFLGRRDHQVKLRGFRIELEEIENTISAFSERIRQVIVTIKEVDQEQMLVAYVVGEGILHKGDLVAYLRKKLPLYMIPNHYVELDTMPLNPNGKIDRKALPNVMAVDVIKTEYVAPDNAIEEALVEIWQEALNLDRVGVTDNFFELGGHSLRAIKIISAIRQKFNINIEINVLFQAPNISALAKEITNHFWQRETIRQEEVMDSKTI